MAEATVVRGLGGVYTLHRHSPAFTGLAYVRGALRCGACQILVGDTVRYTTSADPDVPYVMNELLPRRTCSKRPAVANLDRLLIVVSIAAPRPDWLLIERLIVLARAQSVEPALVVTKCDLATSARACATYDQLLALASAAKAPCFVTGEDGDWVRLNAFLAGGIAVLAGLSGVGKSTLLNALIAGAHRPTGALGQRSQRGRHTTRDTTLYPLEGGGYVADTPGFSALTLTSSGLTWRDVERAYPDIARAGCSCRFANCRHLNEYGCAVVSEGVASDRLARYRTLVLETYR